MRALQGREPYQARDEASRYRSGFAIATAATLAASVGLLAFLFRRNASGSTSSLSGPGGGADIATPLTDPKTFRDYDAAMGDLGDAGGAPSLGGPAA